MMQGLDLAKGNSSTTRSFVLSIEAVSSQIQLQLLLARQAERFEPREKRRSPGWKRRCCRQSSNAWRGWIRSTAPCSSRDQSRENHAWLRLAADPAGVRASGANRSFCTLLRQMAQGRSFTVHAQARGSLAAGRPPGPGLSPERLQPPQP